MNRIRMIRESREETQKDLAEVLQISQSTLSKWERGDYEPDYAALLKIAKRYGVSVDFIIGYAANRTPQSVLEEYLAMKFNVSLTSEDLKKLESVIEMVLKFV